MSGRIVKIMSYYEYRNKTLPSFLRLTRIAKRVGVGAIVHFILIGSFLGILRIFFVVAVQEKHG